MTVRLVDAVRIGDGMLTAGADQPKRRTLTAEYKAAILAEYDAADGGELGAILPREDLYSSHIVEWRKAAEAGAASALGSKSEDLVCRVEMACSAPGRPVRGRHRRCWRRTLGR